MSRDRKSDAHRKAAAHKLGRPLAKGEVVHHLDEDKANNAHPNLEVKPSGKHTADHNRTRGLSKLRRALSMAKRGEKLY